MEVLQEFRKALMKEILQPFKIFESPPGAWRPSDHHPANVSDRHNLVLIGKNISPMYTPINFWFREMKMRVIVSNFCEEVNLADPDAVEHIQKFIEECRVTCLRWAQTLDIVALTDREIYIRGNQ